MNHQATERDIEMTVRIGQVLDQRRSEVDVDTFSLRLGPGRRNHLRRGVDACHILGQFPGELGKL